MMVPINYLAVLVCAVVAMALGFLWYGPLFGKQYLKYIGVSNEDMERAKTDPVMKRQMMWNYVTTFVAALIMAFILDHALIFASSYLQWSGLQAGLFVGFANWIGFVAPATLGGVLWERKPWGWFWLVGGYYLVLLLVMGYILALWI